MIEMSSPKHIKYINEFPYFHNEKLSKRDIVETYYATAVIQSLPPYFPLENIENTPKRDYNFKVK
jgi:UDP-galactopyranose mutase